jgi:hypothetical protein
LVKDEIISVANGNIQKFEIISEVQIPNGIYSTSLKATVSVTKLTSFVESKGVEADFKGNLFAFNIKQQILNESNEIKALKDLRYTLTNLMQTCFDYNLILANPVSGGVDNQNWIMPLTVEVKCNRNIEQLQTLFNNSISSISLSDEGIKDYETLQKEVYEINYYYKGAFYKKYLRQKISLNILNELFLAWNQSISEFYINNGITSTYMKGNINFKMDDRLFINNCSLRTNGKGYEWYTLVLEPIKIKSYSVEIKEGSAFDLQQVGTYEYKGTSGARVSKTIIFPESNNIIANFKYKQELTLEALNKVTKYSISKQ